MLDVFPKNSWNNKILSDTSEIKPVLKKRAVVAHWDQSFVVGTCTIH